MQDNPPGVSFRKLVKMAKDQGWTVEKTKKNHIRFRPYNKAMRAVVTASTPSDHRWIRNLISDLRKSGLVFENPPVQDNPLGDDPLEGLIHPDSSWFDPDEMWGRPLMVGDPACDIARLHRNPAPPWFPMVDYSSKNRAREARDILFNYGIKPSSNRKTFMCISQTRNLSCRMSRWCEKFCYGKAQNHCRPNSVTVLIDNYDAFQFLATASQQIVDDVAWALIVVSVAWGLNNLRVPGIGDFTPGLIRVVDAMTSMDSEFTVWGFTRKHTQDMPVKDNLVIQASIDPSMSEKRIEQAIDFAEKHQTGLSYSTECGTWYEPRDGKSPQPPWWNPVLFEEQPPHEIDPFLAWLFDQGIDLDVIFGYHGNGRRRGLPKMLLVHRQAGKSHIRKPRYASSRNRGQDPARRPPGHTGIA